MAIGLTGITALEAEMRDRLAGKDAEIKRLRDALETAAKVPSVGFNIEWHGPAKASSSVKRYNSDAAKSRLADVARAAVEHALESGAASVTITVVTTPLGSER